MKREAKIGIFLGGAFLIIAVVIFIVGDVSELFKKPGYRLDVIIDSALGLEVSSPVKMAGIKIGRVKDVHLSGRRALIVMNIYPQYRIPVGSKGNMASLGLLGEKYLEIVPSQSDKFFEPGAILESQPSVSFDQIGTLFVSIGNEIKDLSRSVKEILDKKTSDNLRNTLENLSSLTAELNDLVVKNKGSIGETFDNASMAFKDMSREIKEISESLNGAVSQYGDLASENKASIRTSMEKIQSILSKIEKTVEKLDESVEKVRAGKGTLGRLVNETKLYDEVESTVSGVKNVIKPVSSLKAGLELRGDFYGKSDLLRGAVTFNVWSGSGKLFSAQVLQDPWKDRVVYSLQGGIRLGSFVPRAGIFESNFGAGLDYTAVKDKLSFSVEGFDFNRTPKPRLRAFTKFYPTKSLFFVFGLDDFALPAKRELFFGMGVGLR
jgi:phospholipid/cholesterol/gamma-HCH transport system substrate-binding protein